VARVIIESDNSLDSICGAGRTGSEIAEQEEFPSWVIDWRIRIDIERQLRPYLYSTAAGTKPQFAFTNGGRGLDIKGLSICSVLDSMAPLERDDLRYDEIMRLKGTSGLHLWAEHFRVYPTGCTPKSAWVRTITVDLAGRGGGHIRQSKEIQAQFEALYLLDKSNEDDEDEEKERGEEGVENEEHNEDDGSLINTVLNEPGDVSVRDAFPLDGRPDNQRTEWINQTVVNLGLSIFNGIDQKCFFISRSGYMGMASNLVMKGDLICVIAGCNVPLVIREEVDHHVLVGECFVWGLMDGEYGEVLRSMEEENVWETFRLR
jgi:hypothetical protein